MYSLKKAGFSIQLDDVNPFSSWFSYGSNLSALDFESKMRAYYSNLTLLSPLKCTLKSTCDGKRVERKLDNRSSKRGLAYALHELPTGEEEPVVGIIHDVPIADICAFLRFEGVLDESYQVMPKGDWQDFNGKRTYDIKRVVVTIEDAPNRHDLNCLALFGSLQVPEDKREQEILKRDKYESEVVYVLTAMKGAADFEIDTLPFEKDLSRVKTWGKKTASSR